MLAFLTPFLHCLFFFISLPFYRCPLNVPSLFAFIFTPDFTVSLSLLSTVPGLSSFPVQKQPHLSSSRREGLVSSHKPLERTRSEPPPYSHSPLPMHTQHSLLQQYHKSGLDMVKQNSHLSKVRGGRCGHRKMCSPISLLISILTDFFKLIVCVDFELSCDVKM